MVNELVNNIPGPVTWQLNVDRTFRIENVVEELAVVLVRMESLLSSRLEKTVQMTVVNFGVEDQEGRIIDQRSNDSFRIWPRGIFIKVFCQLVESILVAGVQLVGVALVELLLEMQNKVLNSLGDVVTALLVEKLAMSIH